MPKLTVFQGDITCLNVDAVVNAANGRMLGGGGVDGAIHNAAGRRLRAACERVPEVAQGIRCPWGEARITPGFDLPAKVVIHTVGPVYAHKTGQATHRSMTAHADPATTLANCYRNSLKLAAQYRHRTIAFAAISCGVYGYPPDEAAAIAVGVALSEDWDVDEIIFVAFEDEVRDALNTAIGSPPDVSSASWLDVFVDKAQAAQAAPAPVPAAPAAPPPTPATAPTVTPAVAGDFDDLIAQLSKD